MTSAANLSSRPLALVTGASAGIGRAYAERLASDAFVSQSSLALDLGYTDQAHFAHDFKTVVGMSPAAYAKAGRRAQR